MPSNTDSLLKRLEAVRAPAAGRAAALRALREAAGLRLTDPDALVRLHEAVLFLRAYPHDARVLRAAERVLERFADRIRRLRSRDDDVDLSVFDAPEVAGVAGTEIATDYSFDLVRWLLRRHRFAVSIDWDACDGEDRMRATWPSVPAAARGGGAGRRQRALPRRGSPRRREGPPGTRTGSPAATRPFPSPRATAPSAGTRWASRSPGTSSARAARARGCGGRGLAAVLSRRAAPRAARTFRSIGILGESLRLRRLPPDGRRSAFATSCARRRPSRYREFYTFTYADPSSVLAARPGRGVELFLIGVLPGRRLPLRAAYGGFVVKNGVPIGYIEGLALLRAARDRLQPLLHVPRRRIGLDLRPGA